MTPFPSCIIFWEYFRALLTLSGFWEWNYKNCPNSVSQSCNRLSGRYFFCDKTALVLQNVYSYLYSTSFYCFVPLYVRSTVQGPAACRAAILMGKAVKPPTETLWLDEQTQPLPRSVRQYLHSWVRAEDLASDRWGAEVVVFEVTPFFSNELNSYDIFFHISTPFREFSKQNRTVKKIVYRQNSNLALSGSHEQSLDWLHFFYLCLRADQTSTKNWTR